MSSPSTTIERFVVAEPGYGRAPRICADRSGRLWVAWIAWSGDGERVRICALEPGGAPGPAVDCGPARVLVTGAALTRWRDGVIVAWVDGDDPLRDGLKLAAVGADGDPAEPVLVTPWGHGPSQPCLAAAEDAFALGFGASESGGRVVRVLVGADPARPGAPVTIAPGPGIRRDPAVAVAAGRAWAAWARFGPDGAHVVACPISASGPAGDLVHVDGGRGGICAQPCLCPSPADGLWIAWQSDVDPVHGPGLVRWIEMAHLDEGGQLRRPADQMPGVDRQERSEDQGFEAPSLVLGPDRRLIVIGRRSQSIARQDLGAAGWTERVRVDEPGWKCRGRRFEVAATAQGVFAVGRERDGIAIRRLAVGDPGQGGMARLGPRIDTRRPAPSPVPTPSAAQVCGHRVLFGDIHQHTAASDGTGTHAETFCRAACRYRDDVVAVADHESFLGKRTPPGEWAEACAVADDFAVAGAIATLHAFEWTGKMHPGPGHKVVYLSADGGPVLSRDDGDTGSSAGLVERCREIGALAFPHHVGWTGADREAHDPRVQTCFEIVSCHGAYERHGIGPIGTRGDDKPGEFVGDVLDAGLRFGLTGGSDGHGLNWHHGICRMADSHRSGLSAVFADAPTRAAVLDALRARRCYATSGAKILLWFEVDGRPMGSEIRAVGPVPYRVVVEATAPVKSVSLVTNGGAELALPFSGRAVDASGTLDPPRAWAYYYLRAVQRDDHVAWSSPIWLDRG